MKKEYIIYIFLILTPLIQGLYFEYSFCFANLFLIAALIYLIIKNKGIYYKKSVYLYILGSLPIIYTLVGFIAIDKGINIYGVMKVLEPFLFYLVITQMKLQKNKVIEIICASGIIMGTISILSLYIETWATFFIRNNRLFSFFDYANTYALYSLICLVLLQYTEWKKGLKVIYSIILVLAIVFTYSRGVYIIGLAVLAASIIIQVIKRATNFWYNIIIAIMAVLLYFLIINTSPFITYNARAGEISIGQSELQARILYYIDAIKIIAHNLWGLGYDGYYHIQGMYQTGIYKVRLVHNSLLQIGLEIGVAGILAYIGILINYAQKTIKNNLDVFTYIFVIIGIHSLMDFDMTFLVIVNIMILVLYFSEHKEENKLLNAPSLSIIISCILFFINAVLGVSSLLYQNGYDTAAISLYPNNTEALYEKGNILFQDGDYEECIKYLEKIEKLNNTDADVKRMKRDIYINKGQLESAIELQKEIILLDGLNIEEVEKYSDLLLEILMIRDYNIEKKEKYKKELFNIREHIKDKKTTISEVAFKQKRMPTYLMTKKLLENEEKAKIVD